jgi:hypothetical protein
VANELLIYLSGRSMDSFQFILYKMSRFFSELTPPLLDDPVPTVAGNFSLRRVQTGSEAHPASYSMCNRGFFPGGKAARV